MTMEEYLQMFENGLLKDHMNKIRKENRMEKIYLKPLTEWTEKELENELKGVQQSIEVAGYGTKDLILRDNIEEELDRRAWNERFKE